MDYRYIRPLGLIGAAALLVVGCGGNSGGSGSTEQTGEVLFAPTAETVPSPNDLAFNGSADATLANAGNEDVNGIDGFSTTTPATASATVAIDSESIDADSVQVFEVSTQGDPNSTQNEDPAGPKGVTGVERVLSPGTDFTATVSAADRNNRTIAVTPTRPLKPDTTYMVVLTDDLEAQRGGSLQASRQYELAKRAEPLVNEAGASTVDSLSDGEAQQLEGVRQLVQSHLAVAGGAGVAAEDAIASWTFTTQTVGDVLAEVDSLAGEADLSAPAFGDTEQDTPQGAANVWAGVLTGLPYYLAPASDANDSAPREEYWQAENEIAGERNLTGDNSIPRPRDTVAVPVVVAIPKAGCESGCPVAIYQHGITSDRTRALGIADTLASLPTPHATIAIDLPLHGLTDTENGLFAGEENPALQPAYAELGNIERTFDLDLQDNETGAAGPDGEIDASGAHFVNLESLRSSRDNLRQGVADLLALVNGGVAQIAGTINAASGGAISLDPTSVDFIGQSLGGMVGTPFLAQAGDRVERAVLSAPGGGIAKLLDGSPAFGPEIEAGLSAEGLSKGTPLYEQFLGAAQTAVDSGDPINYAQGAVADTQVLMLEVVGGVSSPADQVIPNNLLPPFQEGTPDGTIPSPIAGTDPLATAMGLNQVGASNSPAAPGTDTIVRFTAGAHSSVINPEPDATVTQEMQSVVGTFLESGATEINDSSVVADPE